MARLIRMTPPIGAKIDAGHLYHALRLFRATGATAVYRR